MKGKVFPVVLRGYVVRPAERVQTQKGREFMRFSVAVDDLAGNGKTGWIGCSYWPGRDKELSEDVVACALAWISADKNNPVKVNEEGFFYTRMEVTVTGQLSLSPFTRTNDSGDEVESGAYYINLQFCQIDIHDYNIVRSVKSCIDGSGNVEEGSGTQQGVEQPTVAPQQSSTPQQAVSSAPIQPTTAPVAQQPAAPVDGQIVTDQNGQTYMIQNGKYIAVHLQGAQPQAPALQAPAPQPVGAPTVAVNTNPPSAVMPTTQQQSTAPSIGDILNNDAQAPTAQEVASQQNKQ